jgi:hypothetical protein
MECPEMLMVYRHGPASDILGAQKANALRLHIFPIGDGSETK